MQGWGGSAPPGSTSPPPSTITIVQLLIRLQLFLTPWTVACQAPLSMEFPRQEYRNTGCYFLLQGIFPTQGSNPHLLHWQVDSLPLSHQGRPTAIITCIKGALAQASSYL